MEIKKSTNVKIPFSPHAIHIKNFDIERDLEHKVIFVLIQVTKEPINKWLKSMEMRGRFLRKK